MTHVVSKRSHPNLTQRALLAGLAGGLAEMLWIGLYTSISSSRALVIASEISRTVMPAVDNPILQPVLGVAIHILISVALALVFAWVIFRPFLLQRQGGVLLVSAVATLFTIWLINFFIILPLLNPGFVALLPYSVSLASKLLYGIVIALVLSFPIAEKATHRVSASG